MTESDAIPEAGGPVSAGLASGKLPPQLREVMFLAAAAAEAGESVSAGLALGKLPPQLQKLVAKSSSTATIEQQRALETLTHRSANASITVLLSADDLNNVVRFLASLERSPSPEASRPTGVLVVSTDLDTRLLLVSHLEKLGYHVWTADCGSDAYQLGIEHSVAIDALLCVGDFSDLPPSELYSQLKKRLPGLRCCVLAALRIKQQNDASEAQDVATHPRGEVAKLWP